MTLKSLHVTLKSLHVTLKSLHVALKSLHVALWCHMQALKHGHLQPDCAVV